MSEIRWKRLAAEGAAIVLSILLAFWIDAWWDARQRQADERVALNALLSDLREYRDGLNSLDKVYDAIRESAVTLLNASLAESSSLDDEQIDQMLYDLSWTLNPSYYEVPTLDALRNDDLFSGFEDVELQRDIAKLVIGIEGVQNDVRRDEKFFDDHWTPYLIANASLPQIYNASSRIPGFPKEEYPSNLYGANVTQKRSHRALLGDNQFQGLLQERANTLADVFTRVPGFDENLNRVIEQLENRLSE